MTRRAALAAIVAVTALVLSGCEIGEDDEMVAPRRTTVVSPSPEPRAVPESVPVGQGRIGPQDVVWTQGHVLHIGTRTVDLSPVGVDAFVVVTGGVYLLDRGSLSFTDLERVRATGLTGVTGLGVTADAERIRVTTEARGKAASHVYDTRSGSLRDEDVSVVSAEERLGTPVGVRLRGERVVLGRPGAGELAGRQGAGRYGVATGPAGEPVAFDSRTRKRIALRGSVPRRFELAGWTSDSTVFGLEGTRDDASAVVACGLADQGSCTRLGEVGGPDPVIFGTGA